MTIEVLADDADQSEPASGFAPLVLEDRSAAPAVTTVVPPPARSPWITAFRRKLVVSDLLAVVGALIAADVVEFARRLPATSGGSTPVDLRHLLAGVGIGLAWIVSLSLADSRSLKVIGAGGEEYARIIKASVKVYAALAIVAYLADVDMARGYLAVGAPVGTALLLLERRQWRKWLAAKRLAGEASRRAVIVGSPADVAHISSEIARVPKVGLRVVGVYTPDRHAGGGPQASGVDDVEQILKQVRAGGVDAVVVASGGDRARETVRHLGWALEGTGVSLMIEPSLAQVAGRRIHLQPVAGITLMHLEEPKLPRGGQVVKEVFDRAGSLILIALLAPVFAAVALAVRLTSPGPAFFRQERICRGGTTFSVWKFRSMHVGADAELPAMLRAAGRDGTPLFKPVDDPRITRVGRFIRRYSLDELPQLFNVLAGQMSLVGPRPQRAAEVELYDAVARRRLLAKPGMTGLWQVSGRSDLSWEEAVRHDVYYVENWSFTLDLMLLWKTIWTVLRGDGAR